VFAAVVLLVFGVAQLVGGALGTVFVASLRRAFGQALRDAGLRIEATALTSVLAAVFVVLLLVGVLHVVAAAGVLAHRNWGRVLGLLLGALGVLIGAILLYRAIDVRVVRAPLVLAAAGVLVPYTTAFAALLFPGRHFGRRRTHG